MPSPHLGLEQQQVVVGLVRTQPRHPLGRFPVLHAAVVVARHHQHRRVGLCLHVLVRCVGLDPLIHLRFLRVAPFVVLGHGQRQLGVEHGVEHVDERHFGNRTAEQLGAQVEHRAHQQATGAAATDGQAVGSRDTLGDQVFGTGDEVAEGVVLVLLLAGAVPGFAQFAAATHMGDGKGHAALQQAQARVREPRVEAFAIGAVAIQVQRHGLAQVLAAAHQADRHPGAVRCGSPQALADIVVGIERPQHRGLLEHRLGTAGQLQLAYLGRAVECFVAQAQAWAGKLQAVLHVQAVGRVGQFDAVGRQALWAYLDDRQAAFAQAQGQRAGIQAEAFKHDRVAVRYQHLPLLTAGHRCDRGVVQGEVDAVLVGADEPAPLAVELAVVGEVLVAFDPWRQAGERCLRGFRVQYPGFAGGLAVEQQYQLAFGAGAVAVQEEAPVGLLEHGLRAFVAQGVATQAPRAVGVVQFGEEQRLAVVGPGQAAVAVVEGQGSDAATGQVLHVQGEDFVAAGVQAVGQQAVVGADVERAEGQEAAIGQGVGVEQ